MLLAVTTFAFLFPACSSFVNEDSDGSVTVALDSKLFSSTASRSIFEADESYNEERSVKLKAVISGDYSATSVKTITSQSDAAITFKKIPVGSKITVSLALSLEYSFNDEQEQYDYADKSSTYEIYSGEANLKVRSGKNNVSISLANLTAPYFTAVSNDLYYTKNDESALCTSRVAVPSSYGSATSEYLYIYDYNTEHSLFNITTTDYAKLSTIESEFESYLKSPSSYENNAISINPCIYNSDSSNFSATQTYGSSLEADLYTLKATIPLEDVDEKLYALWAIVYKTPLGTQKIRISTPTEVTVVNASTSFEITAVSYTGKIRTDSDGNEYILNSEFDASAFTITEKWGDTEISADMTNYSSAVESITSDTIGEVSINFTRYGGSKTWTMTFKYMLPDLEKGYLNLSGTSLSLLGTTVSTGNSDNWCNLVSGEEGNGYTPNFTWKKDGKEITGYANSSTDNSIDILNSGFGTGDYTLTVTLKPNATFAAYCVYADGSPVTFDKDGEAESVSKTYGPLHVSTAESTVNLSLGIPEFTIEKSGNMNSSGKLLVTNASTEFTAYFTDSSKSDDKGEKVSASDYEFAWYLNGILAKSDVLSDDGATFSLNPVQIDTTYYKLSSANNSANSVMLILTSKADSTKRRSKAIKIYFGVAD